VHRLAFVLADLSIHLIGRIRTDRVLLGPAPPRPAMSPRRCAAAPPRRRTSRRAPAAGASAGTHRRSAHGRRWRV